MNFPGNDRGAGITDALHNSIEWPVLLLFGLITQLGDVWFLFLLSGCLYVAGNVLPWCEIDRRRGLFVLALVLTYVSLSGALKAIFQFSRPPGAGTTLELSWMPSTLAILVESITTAETPGFPSGHALGSTMVWGSLALVFEWGSFQKRVGVAAGVILLISVSRLVLGLHYLVDVVVGIGLGVVVLGILYWVADNGTDPEPVLLAAVVIGGAGLLVGITFISVSASGGAVGAWLGWRVVAKKTPARPATRREILAAFLIFGAAAAFFGGLYVSEPPLSFTFLGAVMSSGMAIGAPLLSHRFA